MSFTAALRGPVVALLLAGCSTTPSPGGGTANPPASQGPSGPAAVFHAAPDLEARMPTDANGSALTVESVLGTGFESSRPHRAGLRCRWYETRGLRCRDQAALVGLVGRLGKAASDVSISVAYDRTRGSIIEIQALRIAGTTGQQVLDAQLAVEGERASATGDTLDAAPLEVGGRQLTVIRNARSYPLGEARYLLATADVLFEIRKTDETTLAAVLAKLP
jgi:hypothetical protein